MEALQIQHTHTTPDVNFLIDPYDFTIEGECRPENVLTFFTPIVNWMNKFRAWAGNLPEMIEEPINFHFKLEYYNSSSAKFIYGILSKLKTLEDDGLTVKVYWYYDELDEDLLENGKEFEKILHLDFDFKPHVSN